MKALKPFFRVIALDDGYFKPFSKGKTSLVGVVWRTDNKVEGILHTKISVDGTDVSKEIVQLIKKSKFEKQISFILLQGITFAGFNVADPQKIFKQLKKPVIIVFKKNPSMKKISKAIKKFKDSRKRLAFFENAGKIHSFNNRKFQCIGCTPKRAQQVIKKTLVHSNIPEPIRLSHLIASGTTIGQSTVP